MTCVYTLIMQNKNQQTVNNKLPQLDTSKLNYLSLFITNFEISNYKLQKLVIGKNIIKINKTFRM